MLGNYMLKIGLFLSVVVNHALLCPSLCISTAKQKFAYTMPHPPNEHICCLPFNVNSIIILTEFATADNLQVPVSCRVHLVNSLTGQNLIIYGGRLFYPMF